MVSKNLIVQIKIPLTFYQNRTAGRIKIIQGIYQSVSERLLKRQKCRRADRYPNFLQFIEKIDKHISSFAWQCAWRMVKKRIKSIILTPWPCNVPCIINFTFSFEP